MTICGHTGWLSIRRCGDDHYLETSDRPHRLLRGVQHAELGIPGLLVLIGNQKKQLALTRLRIGDARLCKRRSHGEIHLFLSTLKSSRGASIIIADGDLPRHNRLPTTLRSSQCHELGREKFSPVRSANAVEDLGDRVYHRSVFPLADTICIFVDDVGGIHNALRHIASWDKSGPASTSLLRPRLLLIVSTEHERSSRVALNKYMSGQRKSTVAPACFQEISIACFPWGTQRNGRCRPQRAATWSILRQNVLEAMENARIARQKAKLMFSACHVAEFLCHGARLATKAQWASFDFVKASRRYTPVATDLESHISNFIALFDSECITEKVAMPLIASSFVLDHYTPQMHGKEAKHPMVTRRHTNSL